MGRYEVDPRRDPDLQAALEARGEKALAAALAEVCRCGHTRGDHMAATGALGSFGGTACDKCWTCGTFTPVDSARAEALRKLLFDIRRAEFEARDAA